MTKLKFLLSLHDKLSDLPQDEVEERLNFYSEMIEDRMEEGLSEKEAVSAVGSVEEIAAQIASDIPTAKTAEKIAPRKKRLKWWETALLFLGSPIWLSLLLAAFAVVFSLYICLWAVLISLWAVFVSLIACAFAGIAAGIGFALGINILTGTALIGTGIICAGLAIFLLLGCKAATKGTLLLTKKTALTIKNRFAKEEEA